MTKTSPGDQQIFEQILSNFTNEKGRPNLVAAFKAHPDWADHLNWHNQRTRGRVYAALASTKLRKAKEAKANGNGKPHTNGRRIRWGSEEVQLVKLIQADPRFTNGNGTKWASAFKAHPEWARALHAKANPSAFRAFLTRRLYSGRGELEPTTPVAHSTAPGSVVIDGQEFTEQEIRQRMLEFHVSQCPNCHFNLEAFNKAYSYAMAHSKHLSK